MSRLFFAQSLRTAVRDVARQPSIKRSFSSLPTLRPSTSTPTSIFARRPTTLLQTPFTPTATASVHETADIVPTSAISAHPALLQSQIRCGPRRYMNMNRPSRLIRNRRVGFLTRMKSKDGRKMIARRKAKGRKRLGAA
ncbi:hypothetical protein N0V93_006651 [Gnomoniopsis smithogilvyi]|uniref:Ribosomal protein L34 n=1 Tax=Gnomoniopsis smithogilvyi TaxID=1191159 RepID=A0A9W8YS33_9PEZI|nr:hypothetical protein N0V93_006651 [Gnomoniopsis smithogilvyi]